MIKLMRPPPLCVIQWIVQDFFALKNMPVHTNDNAPPFSFKPIAISGIFYDKNSYLQNLPPFFSRHRMVVIPDFDVTALVPGAFSRASPAFLLLQADRAKIKINHTFRATFLEILSTVNSGNSLSYT